MKAADGMQVKGDESCGDRGREMMMEQKLMACEREYWDFVLDLRTDPRVAEGFISTNPISREEHEAFMTKYSAFYRICLIDGVPAGFVGVVNDDIRVCTHPDFQKKGVGEFMLREIIKEFPTAIGKVKITNEGSKRAFEKAGFQLKYVIFEKE